jgi:hypothetical protein
MGRTRGLWLATGMLRNRSNRTDLFALVPQLGRRFEPQPEQLERSSANRAALLIPGARLDTVTQSGSSGRASAMFDKGWSFWRTNIKPVGNRSSAP